MMDYGRIYHTGVRVPDVDAAMVQLGESLGLTWATVQNSTDRTVWTPERGLEQVELTFVYSCEGPQHVELLRGQPGSVQAAPASSASSSVSASSGSVTWMVCQPARRARAGSSFPPRSTGC